MMTRPRRYWPGEPRETDAADPGAEVGGRPGLDVRVGPGSVEEIAPGLARRAREPVLDAAGGAVIPGLHDHHVHLRAVVAARHSLDVSVAPDPAGFDRLVSAAASSHTAIRWLRVTGWDENRAGPLDRARLDPLTGSVPARVQHRSGTMWVLNSAALAAVGAHSAGPAGIERDEDGRPTGRLLRLDRWLRDRLPPEARESFAAGLAAYASWSARVGVTGFTDATPDRDQADVDDFCALSESGTIRQRLALMAPRRLRVPSALRAPACDRVGLGPQKLILDDATLPSAGDLASQIAGIHRQSSAVAVHCVTAQQLVVCAAAFEQAAAVESASRIPAFADRVEHASIVPPGYADELARLQIAVVTQPASSPSVAMPISRTSLRPNWHGCTRAQACCKPG